MTEAVSGRVTRMAKASIGGSAPGCRRSAERRDDQDHPELFKKRAGLEIRSKNSITAGERPKSEQHPRGGQYPDIQVLAKEEQDGGTAPIAIRVWQEAYFAIGNVNNEH